MIHQRELMKQELIEWLGEEELDLLVRKQGSLLSKPNYDSKA
jgi:hypothetical protein